MPRLPGLLALLVLAACSTRNPAYVHGDAAPDHGVTPDRGVLLDHGPDGPLMRDLPWQPPPPDTGPPPLDPETYYFPANVKKDLDILFVVDNSNSMAEEQKALAGAFPQFVDMLATMSGGMPNVHIGVISSDLGAGNYGLPSCEVPGGDGGKLQSQPKAAGCMPPNGAFITYINGVTNVPGAGSALDRVKSGFSCIAEIGTGGCGFEQTIESSRRALDPALGTNPGFVRPAAMLAVVYLTDEDDCSAQKPQLYDPTQSNLTDPLGPLTSFRCFEFGIQCDINDRTVVGPRTGCVPAYDWLYKVGDYVTFFKALKPPGQLVMAALAGPDQPVAVGKDAYNPALQPSCQSNQGKAVPAIRFKTLLDAFGTASFFSSICAQDYGPALKQLGTLLAAQLGGACLQQLKDTDPSQPGLQASCVVDDQLGGVSTPIPACSAQTGPCGPCPCWRVVPDSKCGALSGYALQVARNSPAASGTIVRARCQGP